MSRSAPRPTLLVACVLCTLGAPARASAQPAPGTPGSEVPADVAAELGRLQGQRVRLALRQSDRGAAPGAVPGQGHGAAYVIEDVAGEGAPVVGVVEQRDGALWLLGEDGVAYRLAGVLARPRIAGPGYKVWVLGAVTVQRGERVLRARRLGVLAPPWQRAQARVERSTSRAISAGAPTRTGGPQ